MTIRLLAKDLYRAQKEIERLENDLVTASIDQRAVIEDKLRKAKAEKAFLRQALDGRLER